MDLSGEALFLGATERQYVDKGGNSQVFRAVAISSNGEPVTLGVREDGTSAFAAAKGIPEGTRVRLAVRLGMFGNNATVRLVGVEPVK
jgi:hypothetical protein